MPMVHQRHGQTDGLANRKTDGRLTISIPRFALRRSRGKNAINMKNIKFRKCCQELITPTTLTTAGKIAISLMVWLQHDIDDYSCALVQLCASYHRPVIVILCNSATNLYCQYPISMTICSVCVGNERDKHRACVCVSCQCQSLQV